MLVTPGDVTTMTFDWGSIKWFVTPYAIQGASSSLGEVIVNPGEGHARHNHPGGEEKALEAAPDYRLHDAGTVPAWEQGTPSLRM
jgi:oxalate decarboxylase/phosphoglucose isomerase-like protein (cupin superfamily)